MTESPRTPFQYSLRSLFVLMLFVSVSVDFSCHTDFTTYRETASGQVVEYSFPLPHVVISGVFGAIVTSVVVGAIYIVRFVWRRLIKRRT